MENPQEKVKKLIEDLKDELPDPVSCKYLDQCYSTYQKIVQNVFSPKFKTFIPKLKAQFDKFLTRYEEIDNKILFSEQCENFEENVSQILTFLENLKDKNSYPIRNYDDYTRTLENISQFCDNISSAIQTKQTNSRLFSTCSEFETSYFGIYVSALSKTRADKSCLSAISVSVGDLCTKMRNINECKNHQQEIDELSELLDIEHSFISIHELQKTLLNVSQVLNELVPKTNQSTASALKEQSQILFELTNRTVFAGNMKTKFDELISDSEDDNEEESEEEIRNKPKARRQIFKPIQPKYSPRKAEEIVTPTKEYSDYSDYGEYDDIEVPEPLFHPKLLSRTVPQKRVEYKPRKQSSPSPPVFQRKGEIPQVKKLPTSLSSNSSGDTKPKKKVNPKYAHLVSSYAQSNIRKQNKKQEDQYSVWN